MVVLTPNLQERKRILSNVCRANSNWKKKVLFSYLLITISFLIILAVSGLLIMHPTSLSGILLFVIAGLCISCVPFFIGLGNKNAAKYKCGLPYSSYANGSLILNDEELEYIFWRVGSQEPAAYSSKHAVYNDEDKFIYKIACADIISITTDSDLCKIKGPGKVIMPDWAEEDQTVKRSFDEFSFAMAFEQHNSQQIINEWRNNNVKF